MLTPEQLAERRKGIGASDSRYIIEGRWHELWLLKTARVEDDDLSDVFAVQMGHATEQLNLDWYERRVGNRVINRGAAMIMSPEMPFMRCTLDGQDATDDTIVEAKHVNGYSKIEDVAARYMPQCQHQMIVTGSHKAILSVIIGTNEPERTLIAFDEFWANEYIEKCREFWQYVIDDRAPEQGAPMDITPAIPISDMRTVDMSGSNSWATNAADWLANKDAAKLFKDSADELKKLVEADVSHAHGNGIEIKRTKVGLTIKETKK